MPDVNVDKVVPLGSLNNVPQDQSIGTDCGAVGVGMIAIMRDGSKWCASFDIGFAAFDKELANIQADTFSMLTNVLQDKTVRLVACTTGTAHAIHAIWEGILRYFPAAEKHCNPGIFASKDGIIGMLNSSDCLVGTKAQQNFYATIPMPIHEPSTAYAGTVQPASADARGFDTDSVVTRSEAQEFASQGYRFCLRYLSLGQNTARGDLTAGEAQNILNAGLALMPVQHVRSPGWIPTGTLGSTDGTNAAVHAQALGVPPGTTIWMDLEGVAPRAEVQAVIDYCTNWYAAMKVYQYLPGIYVGANCGLNTQELDALPFDCYWKSFSNVPPIAKHAYQMVQSRAPSTVNGLTVDLDTIHIDGRSRVPQWWIKAGIPA